MSLRRCEVSRLTLWPPAESLFQFEAGGDDAEADAAVDVGAQRYAAAVVEDIDGVAIGDAAGGRVVGVHFKDAVEADSMAR